MTLTAKECLSSFAEVHDAARVRGPRRVGVVAAEDDAALTAIADAQREGIAIPVLIGDSGRIRARAEALGLTELQNAEFVEAEASAAAETGVSLAHSDAIAVLMKGHLRTDELFHPVLDKQKGLRTGRVMCDVAFFEHHTAEGSRLVALSDGGLNVSPTLEQKKQIVMGVAEALRCLGVQRPRMAVLSAVEVVTEAMPSTVDARALTEMAALGELGDVDLFGPLALDNALFRWAAEAKGIRSEVAGEADALIVPNIEAGNLLAKAIIFLAGRAFGHVVMGAKVPILIPSRVENAEDKLNAIALGVLCAAG